MRPQGNSGATVVYELRARPSMAMVDSRNTPTTPSHPLPAASVRTHTTSVSAEWIGLGFNCGGAVLAWIGVVGTGALAPVTGGASAIGTVVMWGGAIASTGQCAASVYRTANDYRDRQDINNSLNKSQVYQWTMRSADIIGLVGVGGSLKELKTTHAVLMEANVDWKVESAGRFSRPMRRQLTTLLELQGGKRVAGAVIGQLLKKRLLDGAAGALGMVSSAASGMVHEIVVWITDETNGSPATP